MRLSIWLCLVASLSAIGCSSNLPPKDPVAVKKAIQISRAINSPEIPALFDKISVADKVCTNQGGKIYYTAFPNAECKVANKTIFNYFAMFNPDGVAKVLGIQSYFPNDNGGILQMAIMKYGKPTVHGSIAFWYNLKRDVTMSIETKENETVLSFFVSSAFNPL